MSIYHLHIPRTSGGYVRKMITNSLNSENNVVGHYRTISENDFKNAEVISGHYGLNPCKFADKTFTILRDPAELTFSYIKYLSLVPGGSEFNEDMLKKYLYEDNLRNSVTNVMTKFLSCYVNIDKYNNFITNHINMANNSWYLENTGSSYSDAINSIKSNQISVFLYDSDNLYSDIAKFLGVDVLESPQKRINESFHDTSGLFEKYFDEIQYENADDYILYEEFVW
jgi:hypothetical protein